MTLAIAMVLATAVLPYICTAAAKFGGPGYDNADPRAFLSGLTGWRARADAAQRNAFEAFPAFAAAVLAAQYAHAPQGRIDLLACTFVAARVLHAITYVAGIAWLRSVAWAVGFTCVVMLFLSA